MKKNTNIVLISLIVISVLSGCSSFQRRKPERLATVSSTDGSSISYGVRGEGKITVVFIHCWTCNHGFWNEQLEYFSKSYEVVWLDLAGHGLSTSERQQYTMPAFGADVAAVVNHIKADKVILVGHSMGGPVAIEAAKLLGNKVIGIVGVDTFYTEFKNPQSNEKIEGFVKPFKDDFKGTSEQMVRSMFTPDADKELISSIVKEMSVADREMGISAMVEIFRWNLKNVPSSLDRFSAKLRNINGAGQGNEVAPQSSVVIIPSVGHFVAQVKPNEFNKALSQIIAEYQVQ